MKTADEMYDYSVKNGFGKGMLGWGQKSFRVIEQQLLPDEEAIICFIGLHDYVSAAKHGGNFAYALTNKRLILGQKKVLGENVQIIDLNNVNDITKTTGMLSGNIIFDTYKERFTVNFPDVTANKLYPVLQKYLTEFKNPKTIQPKQDSNNSIDELRKYKGLLDDNIITQEEFDAKKRQILGLD